MQTVNNLARGPQLDTPSHGCCEPRTCVTQGKLLFVASLVIPHARVLVSLDVDLHTVFIVLLVVRFAGSPVLGFFG